MSKEVVKGVPIGNLLYTTEGDASKELTKAELEVADPSPERALGILSGTPDENLQKDKEDEQTTD